MLVRAPTTDVVHCESMRVYVSHARVLRIPCVTNGGVCTILLFLLTPPPASPLDPASSCVNFRTLVVFRVCVARKGIAQQCLKLAYFGCSAQIRIPPEVTSGGTPQK